MERDFKGIWIPKEVWLNDDLTMLDKVILMEVDSLDCNEEGCYATNEYLSQFCQCSEIKISKSINKLINLGYLEVLKFDGRRRFIKSRLKQSIRQTNKKYKADLNKVKEINIDNNIIKNNNINIITKKSFKKPTIEEIKQYCLERHNNIDPERFYDFYESKDWMVGRNKMKDWKACVRTWEKNNKQQDEILPSWFNQDIKKEVDEYDELAKQYTRGYLDP